MFIYKIQKNTAQNTETWLKIQCQYYHRKQYMYIFCAKETQHISDIRQFFMLDMNHISFKNITKSLYIIKNTKYNRCY